jgi:predicted aconitase subunit 2 (EC 4.2.1.3)
MADDRRAEKLVSDEWAVTKAIVNKETEPIVATGVILAGIPCVDKIDTVCG